MFNVTQVTLVITGLSVLVGLATLGACLALSWFVQTESSSGEEGEQAADPSIRSRKAAAYRLGLLVILGLAVLTVVEYEVAVKLHSNVLLYLMIIALVKAWLIVQYFMHVSQLWHEEGGHT